mgnify:CR=1 FL=1
MSDTIRNGIDISAANAPLNWTAFKQAPIDFAIMRAGYNAQYLDGLYLRERYGVRDRVPLYGIYLVPKPSRSWEDEWAFTYYVVNAEPRPDFIALDLEIYHPLLIVRAEGLAVNIEHFARIPVVVYTNYGFSRNYDDKAWLGALQNYPLWVANYTTADKPLLPRGWVDYLLWQYSAGRNYKGAAYGVSSRDVDLDRVNPSVTDIATVLKERVL